ncbi:hypothetical protein KCTC52924_00849 [Arenibacter antarcticus]|uniref:Lipoprotein n=1 Tax=Arenibacter antarcticus TaxID=2040469 RepID=A0ABW5VC14_9FLAO|nr:hypothetical protein [Arenibacter sp. H213]MCM4167640.1 hypothetical protein [Arenibacter sp. H213]
MRRLNKLIMLAIAGLMFLGACNKKNKTDTKDKGNIGSAIITLDDGQKIEFKATFNTGMSLFERKLSVGLSNLGNGMLLTLLMYSADPIEVPGTYDGTITLRQQSHDDILKEKYRSTYYKDAETGEEGDCSFTITALSEKRVQGTFSGTLYSEGGNKATISKGKFDISINKEL